ncbi:MAG: glycosyltransferase [Syntrophaceae bacterium]|nr:glycosyltransferase [Syntrophaceae bacterium]
MNQERCLIMFAKYPERGKVKSRLILEGYDGLAADLYRCFIEDLIDRVSKGNYSFQLAYDPPEKKKDFIELFGKDISYAPQEGKDLGMRMFKAFTDSFSNGFRSAVIIGSDSPDIPQGIIEEAFRSLNKHGAVLGPTWDGGYYLIGFSRDFVSRRFFENMLWSTSNVFEETMRRFQEDGIPVHVLPGWRDIDRADDIYCLLKESECSDFGNSRTIKFLKENGFKAAG